MDDQTKFDSWAIVELFGHQKEIGYVTTQAFGQAVMFRVDVPELPEREFVLTRPDYSGVHMMAAGSKVKRSGSPARSRLLGPGAVYAMNPCTEQAAREALENLVHRPLILIEAPNVPQIESGDSQDDSDLCEDCGLSDMDCTCEESSF